MNIITQVCDPSQDLDDSSPYPNFHYNKNNLNIEQFDSTYDYFNKNANIIENEYSSKKQEKENLEFELNLLQKQKQMLIDELEKKNLMNKKLFYDNKKLISILESKKKENEILTSKLEKNRDYIESLSNEKQQWEMDIKNLNGITNQNSKKINKLSQNLVILKEEYFKQNIKLNQTLEEVENSQNILIREKEKNNNLNLNLTQIDSSLDNYEKQFELTKNTIAEIENDIKNLNKLNKEAKDEYDNVKKEYDKKRINRNYTKKQNAKLESLITEKNDAIRKTSIINNKLKKDIADIGNERNLLFDNLDKYKTHIIVLTQQTLKLSEELEKCINEDKQGVNLKEKVERLSKIIINNKNILYDSLQGNFPRYSKENY